MIQENISLLPHNTFGIHAVARYFAEYSSADELLDIIHSAPCDRMLHIGGGSNLLFMQDFDGLVLHCTDTRIERLSSSSDDTVLIRVGAGKVWDELVNECVENGWYGLENLSLIPGEVGASAVQNIGAYGAEAKDYIVEVECMNLSDGRVRTFTNAECQYAYRHSIFKTDEERGKWAVLSVTYQLSTTFTPSLDYGGIRNELQRLGMSETSITASQLRDVIINIRQAKLPDPKVQGNAGSFFMNPVVDKQKYNELIALYPNMPHYPVGENQEKIPAGWMIDQCGWKGRALGPAAVHDRQALVLVNLGGATGADIVNLCNTVRADVKAKFGIDIYPEVNFI